MAAWSATTCSCSSRPTSSASRSSGPRWPRPRRSAPPTRPAWRPGSGPARTTSATTGRRTSAGSRRWTPASVTSTSSTGRRPSPGRSTGSTEPREGEGREGLAPPAAPRPRPARARASRFHPRYRLAVMGAAGDLPPDPDRNLALELVRVTEAAAIAAGRFMGRGDKERVDQAAVDAMRPVLASIAMDGIVVIGEGEKDEAPMLYNGERVSNGSRPAVDVAVDPVDGTTLTAKSLPDALAVIALAERGAMFDPGPCVYMEKLAVAGDIADAVDLDASTEDNLRAVARVRGKRPEEITVAILDRPRHADLVAQVLGTGARIKFMLDGDVAGAIMAADEHSSVDLLVGIGGTPEGVIAACAMKCLDGAIFGRLYPRDEEERQAALDEGYDLEKVLTTDDLVAGGDVFFAATGVTDGELLRGVRYGPRRVLTQSLSMRSKSGAVRVIEGRHHTKRSNLIRMG